MTKQSENPYIENVETNYSKSFFFADYVMHNSRLLVEVYRTSDDEIVET